MLSYIILTVIIYNCNIYVYIYIYIYYTAIIKIMTVFMAVFYVSSILHYYIL